jgi:hypothetical protein
LEAGAWPWESGWVWPWQWQKAWFYEEAQLYLTELNKSPYQDANLAEVNQRCANIKSLPYASKKRCYIDIAELYQKNKDAAKLAREAAAKLAREAGALRISNEYLNAVNQIRGELPTSALEKGLAAQLVYDKTPLNVQLSNGGIARITCDMSSNAITLGFALRCFVELQGSPYKSLAPSPGGVLIYRN